MHPDDCQLARARPDSVRKKTPRWLLDSDKKKKINKLKKKELELVEANIFFFIKVCATKPGLFQSTNFEANSILCVSLSVS